MADHKAVRDGLPGGDGLPEESFQGLSRVLAQKIEIDLDAKTTVRLDTNNPADDRDFIPGHGNVERDL